MSRKFRIAVLVVVLAVLVGSSLGASVYAIAMGDAPVPHSGICIYENAGDEACDIKPYAITVDDLTWWRNTTYRDGVTCDMFDTMTYDKWSEEHNYSKYSAGIAVAGIYGILLAVCLMVGISKLYKKLKDWCYED